MEELFFIKDKFHTFHDKFFHDNHQVLKALTMVKEAFFGDISTIANEAEPGDDQSGGGEDVAAAELQWVPVRHEEHVSVILRSYLREHPKLVALVYQGLGLVVMPYFSPYHPSLVLTAKSQISTTSRQTFNIYHP